ncbi:MAG: hypothetical protein Q4Q53_03670 [Methanocorpusculum sp.]|nr:hypothetical protein [Methanocorpusculum sp.]
MTKKVSNERSVENSPPPLSEQKKNRRTFIKLTLITLVVMLICAGCVTNTPVKTTETDIPLEMYEALDELGSDLITLEHSVLSDLESISKEIADADESEIKSILKEYYATHPCLTAVIFLDAVHNEYTSVPVFVDVDLFSYSKKITEQDFKDAGGVIVRNNVFTKHHGYQNLYYKPVYKADGTYHGYLVLVTDVYSLLYLHPLMLGTENTYSDCICFITDGEGSILYSSIAEATGETIPENGFYDGLAYIPGVKSGDGACKYTSDGFYIYDKDVQSEKTTAWHTIYSSHGQKYILYLIKETNPSELKTDNVFTLNTQQALNEIREAYVYASASGTNKLAERINSGYYETPLYLINMDGNIIASSDKKTVGLNYLNKRDMYGVSYIDSGILTAEQGGGYIYYLTPAERVVYPRAAQYTLGAVMSLYGTENYFIYCKFPGLTDAVLNDINLRPDISRVSRAVLEEVSVSSVEEVCKIINANGKNSAEQFVSDLKTEISDIAVLDVDGNLYASVVYPELVGKSATFITDVYGGSSTRKANLLAKTGSGYMETLYPNAEKEGFVDLYVASVEPIDDKYYVYVSSLAGTFEDVLTPVLNQTK